MTVAAKATRCKRIKPIVPEEVRSAGFSPAYRLAKGRFGGFTPVTCNARIRWAGNKAMSGHWVSATAELVVAVAMTGHRAAPPAPTTAFPVPALP